MALHRIAAFGLGLVAANYLVYLLTVARLPWGMLPATGFAAALAAAAGLWMLPDRRAPLLLASGLGGFLLVRVAVFAVWPPRDDPVSALAQMMVLAGVTVATFAAARWALRPQASPGRALGAGLGLAGAGYFVNMANAVGGGMLVDIAAYTLAAVGFFLAAPFLDAAPVPTREFDKRLGPGAETLP